MEFLSLDNLVALGMLILLQAVLGFDNLLYISLESKRVPAHRQAMVRRLGIGIAVLLRIVLLFVLLKMVQYFQDPMFGINIPNVIASEFNFHSLIVLLTEGGHLAHLKLFGHEIVPMSKATFYFVITVLVLTDVVQTRYRKRLELLRRGEAV
jgi:predicted tellurium resistance membrane protein TerC